MISPWTEQEFLDRSRRVEHYTGVEVDLVTGEWIAYRNGRIAGWYKTQDEARERLEEIA